MKIVISLVLTALATLLIPNTSFGASCKNNRVESSYSLAPDAGDADKQSLCQIVIKKPTTYIHFDAQDFAFVLQNTKSFRDIGDIYGESTILSILFLTSGFGRDARDLKNVWAIQKKTDGCMTIEALGTEMAASLRQNGDAFQQMVRKWDHDAFLKFALTVMYQSHPECHVHE